MQQRDLFRTVKGNSTLLSQCLTTMRFVEGSSTRGLDNVAVIVLEVFVSLSFCQERKTHFLFTINIYSNYIYKRKTLSFLNFPSRDQIK